jgi:hypothetical protein
MDQAVQAASALAGAKSVQDFIRALSESQINAIR